MGKKNRYSVKFKYAKPYYQCFYSKNNYKISTANTGSRVCRTWTSLNNDFCCLNKCSALVGATKIMPRITATSDKKKVTERTLNYRKALLCSRRNFSIIESEKWDLDFYLCLRGIFSIIETEKWDLDFYNFRKHASVIFTFELGDIYISPSIERNPRA